MVSPQVYGDFEKRRVDRWLSSRAGWSADVLRGVTTIAANHPLRLCDYSVSYVLCTYHYDELFNYSNEFIFNLIQPYPYHCYYNNSIKTCYIWFLISIRSFCYIESYTTYKFSIVQYQCLLNTVLIGLIISIQCHLHNAYHYNLLFLHSMLIIISIFYLSLSLLIFPTNIPLAARYLLLFIMC